jgi:hypothetical protein
MMNIRRTISLALALMAGLLVVSAVWAQTGGGYDLTWHTVDGGGGTVSGGGYTLMGTAGQPDAGAALTGSGYTLVGGFWWPRTGGAPPPGQHDIYLPLVLRNSS